MTTNIDHNPIIPSVVRKQYQRGMDLPELCRLYDTTEDVIRPLIQGVERDERKDERAILVRQVKELYEEERLGKYAIAQILDKNQKTIRDIVNEYRFKQKPQPKIELKKVKIEVGSMKTAERHEKLAVKIKELQEKRDEEQGDHQRTWHRVKPVVQSQEQIWTHQDDEAEEKGESATSCHPRRTKGGTPCERKDDSQPRERRDGVQARGSI